MGRVVKVRAPLARADRLAGRRAAAARPLRRHALPRRDARLLQEALFDELWEDTQNRIRVTGVSEISVNKHLTDVQKYSRGPAFVEE